MHARAPGGLTNFEHTQDLGLTYTFIAIGANTLTKLIPAAATSSSGVNL